MKDKIVLISGGSSGLGLAATKAFIGAGARVIVASRSLEKFTEHLGKPTTQLRFISTDFSDMESVRALYQNIAEEFEAIDIAVNNVGTAVIKPLTDYEEEEFDYVLNVNLKSLWLGMKYQIPMMLKDKTKHRHIVNVASINGLGGVEFASLYAAAKAGVISLTKSAALELATSNIAVNAIVPGPFETPMLHNALKAQAGGDSTQQKIIEAQYKQFIPKGRFGDPDEFAQTVLWLCTEGKGYISGHSLIIDGGMTSRFR